METLAWFPPSRENKAGAPPSAKGAQDSASATRCKWRYCSGTRPEGGLGDRISKTLPEPAALMQAAGSTTVLLTRHARSPLSENFVGYVYVDIYKRSS